MARMLQALKNLEARGEPVAQPHVPAPSAPPKPESTIRQPAAASAALNAPNLTQVITQLDFAAAQLDSLAVNVAEAAEVGSFTWPELPAAPAWLPPVPASAAPHSAPAPRSAPVTAPTSAARPARHPTAIERAAARMLSDPIRSRPLVDLVERLEADIRQSSCHTVLFTGVGTSDGNVETLVFVATLLAERRKADVLVVDADLSRRQITKALICESEAGLSEVLASEGSVLPLCTPLATRGLAILSAGTRSLSDEAADEARVEASLRQLIGQYSLVLIDGGPADSRLSTALARHADATYLVVELGVVEAIQAQAALRDLRAAGARVLGCIAT